MRDFENSRRPSRKLTFDDAVDIWCRILQREFLNRIAADYDVNPGRISEIKTEHTFQGSRGAAVKRLQKGKEKDAA